MSSKTQETNLEDRCSLDVRSYNVDYCVELFFYFLDSMSKDASCIKNLFIVQKGNISWI